MSAPMVRAILEKRKTQTRRIIKPQPAACADGFLLPLRTESPYGYVGDRLWVRENGWQRPYRSPKMMREGADTWAPYYFDADGLTDRDVADFKKWGFKRRPSIHMPRWESRITLEVTAVRVEQVQRISDKDCFAEGIEPIGPEHSHDIPRKEYAALWDKINGRGAWDKNPWVWCISFRSI